MFTNAKLAPCVAAVLGSASAAQTAPSIRRPARRRRSFPDIRRYNIIIGVGQGIWREAIC
jgi:hypothetical protein